MFARALLVTAQTWKQRKAHQPVNGWANGGRPQHTTPLGSHKGGTADPHGNRNESQERDAERKQPDADEHTL